MTLKNNGIGTVIINKKGSLKYSYYYGSLSSAFDVVSATTDTRALTRGALPGISLISRLMHIEE